MHRTLLLAVTASLFLISCGTSSTTPSTSGTSSASQEPVKIGVLVPLTGNVSAFGTDGLHGVELAVAEINAAGGIHGRNLVVIAEDGKCTGSDAAAATQKLIAIDHVVAIIGGLCSGETLAAAPIAEAAKVIVLSPGSSSPDITNVGDYIFRNYPNDADKTKVMAKYFRDRGFKKIAILSSTSEFSQAFHDALLRDLAGDATVVFDEKTDQDTKDFRSILTRLKGVEFDVFFPNISSDTGIALAMKQLRELGMTQQGISHDYGDSEKLIELAKSATEGMQVINVPSSGMGTPFEAKFTNVYGKAKGGLFFAAHSYDALNVLAQVMKQVGTEGPAMRDALYGIKSYSGVVGTFHFDRNGDVVGVPFVLKQFKNGQIVKVADAPVD